MKRIVLHIDRLVLRGFRREDRHGIAEGLRAELGRLLPTPDAARSLIRQDGASRIDAGALNIRMGATPTQVGVQAARRIARGFKS